MPDEDVDRLHEWEHRRETGPEPDAVRAAIRKGILEGPATMKIHRTLTLPEKIFRISNACEVIVRKGIGYSSDPNRPLYGYVRIEDLLEVINPLLKRYKLILTGAIVKEPITHVGKLYATTEILMDWTLTDVESMAQNTWRVPGSGSDDQGKGVYKAMTGSRKYAMVLIFNLKFGDEPEEVQRAEGSEKRSAGNPDPSVS